MSNYSSIITHHNKTPQFYDEVKLLLPLNLNEKHHILFKFYHISCTNAKQTLDANLIIDPDLNCEHSNQNNSISSSQNPGNNTSKNIETLIGFSWLPVFKNGRLLNGEKNLPIAQTLPNNYLSFEQIGLGQSVGPSDIKWVDNMKPLFKVNLLANSTVHTIVRCI